MIHIKLRNVSVKYGTKFRHRQNYSMTFYNRHGVDANTTEEDIRKLIATDFSEKVYLNTASQLEIVLNTDKNHII